MKLRLLKICCALSLGFWAGFCPPFATGGLSAAPASESQLRQQMISQPQNAQVYLQLGELLLRQLRIDWGQRDPQAAGPEFMEQAESFQRRAQELVYLFEKAQQLDPKLIAAQIYLAEVNFVFFNRFEEAEQMLQAALRQQPSSVQAIIALAEFQFFFKNDQASALKALQAALEQQPAQPDLSITLADLLTVSSGEATDFDKARSLLNASIAQQPSHAGLQYMLASVWYRQAQLDAQKFDTDKAREALNIMIRLLQSDPDPQYLLEAADMARSLGQFNQAQQFISEGLQKQPNDPRLMLQLGDLWLQQAAQQLESTTYGNEAQQAEKIYRQLLAQTSHKQLITSQQVQLYYNLGLLLYLKGKAAGAPAEALRHYSESEQMYRQAVQIFDRINIINGPLQQDLGRTLEAKAEVLSAQANTAEALELYRQACNFKLESACNWLKQKGYGP